MFPNSNYNLPKLREILSHASFSDLRIILDDLNETYDAVVGENSNLPEASLKIVDHFRDRGREAALVERVRKEYPAEDWEGVLLPSRWMLKEPFELEMIRIPAGLFLMGSILSKEFQEREKDLTDHGVKTGSVTYQTTTGLSEMPQHKVQLPDFYIARFPVTNEQWRVFCTEVRSNKFVPNGKDNHPVQNASWSSAKDFCHWFQSRARLTRLTVDLPSEAEWEKAARGTTGRIYPWGNQFSQFNCNTQEAGNGNTTPVDRYSPIGDSPYGVADMAGNVWEWTRSLPRSYPYDTGDGRENINSLGHFGSTIVARGGCYDTNMQLARCAFRFVRHTLFGSELIAGFRLVGHITDSSDTL